MKKISTLLASFVLIFALITGCSQSSNNNSNTDKNTNTNQSENTLTKETPLEVLKKAVEVSKNVKGYKYTSKKSQNSEQTSETGEEQYNPQIAHFKTADGIEYYYDKQNIYKSTDGKTWEKSANSSGNVLLTNGFLKLANQLVTAMGDKDTIDGVTLKKESDTYIITVDKKVYKDPDLSAEEFAAIKKLASVAKSELTFDAKTFEIKKYTFELTGEENGEKFNRTQEVELSSYSTPITIPDNVKNS